MSTPIPTLAAPINYMTLPVEDEPPKVLGGFLMTLTTPNTLFILDPDGIYVIKAPFADPIVPGTWTWPPQP